MKLVPISGADATEVSEGGEFSVRISPCRRVSGGKGNRVSGEAYSLALARLESACDALSGGRLVGLNKSGSESASRSTNDTQKNGATRSFVKMGRRTFCRAILRHMETIKSEPRSLRRWQIR